MIKFTTDQEWADRWKAIVVIHQKANENYASLFSAGYFADKLEKAQAHVVKSQLFQDIDEGTRYD